MRIGVLETGPVVSSLVDTYGSYTRFFERLLRPHAPDFVFTPYVAHEGEIPADPSEQDAWVVSGSKHGVYEDHAWLPPLEDFIRETAKQRVAMAGICFGHQIIAQALGGTVVKSDKGWGLGHQTYNFSGMPAYFEKGLDQFSGFAVHQDQVTKPPKDATCLASNDFCEFAVLAYGDPKKPYAITVQPHPEFEPEFMRDLIDSRKGRVFDEKQSEAALATLHLPSQNREWGRWIAEFFKSSVASA